MKSYVTYLATGAITGYGVCQEETFDRQAAKDEFILEASYFENSYVVDSEIKPLPEKPGEYYKFDYEFKEWKLDLVSAEYNAKRIRDNLLKEGPDRINPMWWLSMTPEQQDLWAQYRQALLDITNQPGYPIDITWPIYPE